MQLHIVSKSYLHWPGWCFTHIHSLHSQSSWHVFHSEGYIWEMAESCWVLAACFHPVSKGHFWEVSKTLSNPELHNRVAGQLDRLSMISYDDKRALLTFEQRKRRRRSDKKHPTIRVGPSASTFDASSKCGLTTQMYCCLADSPEKEGMRNAVSHFELHRQISAHVTRSIKAKWSILYPYCADLERIL